MSAISKTPYGTYSVRWRENGKHRSKNFKTKTEARKFQQLLEADELTKESKVTFEQAIDIYEREVTPTKKTQR